MKRPCLCGIDPESGYFEPCCEEHEQEYVAYLQAQYLREHGWKEVPADSGGTCWLAPVTLTGKGHYFDLETAYTLETDGGGIYAYAVEEALAADRRAADVAFMEAQEAARYAKTGIRLGVPPNY